MRRWAAVWSLALFLTGAAGLWGALGALAGAAESVGGVQDDVMVETYRKAIAIDPSDVIAHFNLGLALYKLERFDEAQNILVKCLELNPGDAKAHNQVDGPANQILGTIYYNTARDDRRAIEAFQRSLKYLPNDPDTFYALGLAYQRQKDFPAALKAFDQSVKNGRSQDAELHYQRGVVLAALGREPEAAAAFQEALKYKPEMVPALEELALAYHRQEKDDEAAPLLQRLLKLEPENFNANYLLGLYYYHRKMYSEMVAAYLKVVAAKPDLADAHYNLGMAYYYQTKYEPAVEELKKSVALNPRDAEAYNLLGQAQTAAIDNYLHQGSTYLAQERFGAAIAELQKVFVLDPNNPRARALVDDAQRLTREAYASHIRQADSFYGRDRLEDAYNEYDLALALNPDSAEAQEGRRKSGVQLGKLLAQRLQRAKDAEQAKDYAEAYAQYSSALALKSDYAPAKTALAALKQRLRQDLKKLLALAKAETNRDDVNAALIHYQKARRLLDVLQDPEAQERALAGLTEVNARRADLIRDYLAQGKKLLGAGAEAKAKEAFNTVLKLDPQNKAANEYIVKLTGVQSQAKVTDEEIKATYYKGVDYYVNGKIEEAIQEWEKVIKLDPENQDARINITRAKQKLAAIRKLTQGY
jgi:tetratricopeptide (TPR) repeat protein